MWSCRTRATGNPIRKAAAAAAVIVSGLGARRRRPKHSMQLREAVGMHTGRVMRVRCVPAIELAGDLKG